MIEAIQGKGASRAKASCDDCGREEVVTAAYHRKANGEFEPDEGQIKRKLTAHGWTDVKNTLRCPNCETARKFTPKKEAKMPKVETNITELRRPSMKQKRDIIALLDVSYDTDLERYRGHDTDKTVAETLGGGVMPGWVAEVREELFGPDGGNDEIEALLSDIASWRKKADDLAANAHDAIKEMNVAKLKVADMHNRVEAIRKAVGPKAARA